MKNWFDYENVYGAGNHTVTGKIKVYKSLYSPQLLNYRDILVYLPSNYPSKQYPVIYMQDGQNLFDDLTSRHKEWEVDETMGILSNSGVEAIIVGISNMGENRLAEYTPFSDNMRGGGLGRLYIDFIVKTLQPLIQKSFCVSNRREHTGILGASLGGLISLYGFFTYPSTFGLVGALSPSVHYANGAIFDYIAQKPFYNGKIFMSVGVNEFSNMPVNKQRSICSSCFFRYVKRMRSLLIDKGYVPKCNFLYLEHSDIRHSEESWSNLLPSALRFLLGNESVGDILCQW